MVGIKQSIIHRGKFKSLPVHCNISKIQAATTLLMHNCNAMPDNGGDVRGGFICAFGTGMGKSRIVASYIYQFAKETNFLWITANKNLFNDIKHELNMCNSNVFDTILTVLELDIEMINTTIKPNSSSRHIKIYLTTYNIIHRKLPKILRWIKARGLKFESIIVDEFHIMRNNRQWSRSSHEDYCHPKFNIADSCNSFISNYIKESFIIFLSATPFTKPEDLHVVDFLIKKCLPNYDDLYVQYHKVNGILFLETILKILYYHGMYLTRNISMRDIHFDTKRIQTPQYCVLILNNIVQYINYLVSFMRGPPPKSTTLQTLDVTNYRQHSAEFYTTQIRKQWCNFNARLVYMNKNLLLNVKYLGVKGLVEKIQQYDNKGKFIFTTEITEDSSLNRGISLDGLIFPNATSEQVIQMYNITSKICLYLHLINYSSPSTSLALSIPEPPPLHLLRLSPPAFLDSIQNELGIKSCVEVTSRKLMRYRDKKNPGCYFITNNVSNSEKAIHSFNNDTSIRGIIISGKGATGINLHDSVENISPGRRYHFFVDPSYNASIFCQHIGRSNRTNQLTQPNFIIPTIAGNYSDDRYLTTLKKKIGNLKSGTLGNRFQEESHCKFLDDWQIYSDIDFIKKEKMFRYIILCILAFSGADIDAYTDDPKFRRFITYVYYNRPDIVSALIREAATSSPYVYWARHIWNFINVKGWSEFNDKQNNKILNQVMLASNKIQSVIHELYTATFHWMLSISNNEDIYLTRKHIIMYGLVLEMEDNNILVKILNNPIYKKYGSNVIRLNKSNSYMFNNFSDVFLYFNLIIEGHIIIRLLKSTKPTTNYVYSYAIHNPHHKCKDKL